MAIDTQRVSLDISKQPALQVVRLGQGDANGTELVTTIYDEGQAYDLTGKAVRLRIQLPGGYAEYHVDGTVSGNEATFPIDEAYAASVKGITDNAYVEVLQGGTVVCSTSRFRVVILPSAYEGTDPAHIWDNGVNAFLQSANAQVRELTQDATQAITEAANAESSAASQLDAALDALGDISEIAVPLMSTTTRGGAKLGSGLAITEGKLRTQLVQGGQGIANTPIQADGDLLHGATVDGMSVQDGTPTPSAPVPVQVVDGCNLIPFPYSSGASKTQNGITFTAGADGILNLNGTASSATYYNFVVSDQDIVLPLGNYYLAFDSPLPNGVTITMNHHLPDGANVDGKNFTAGSTGAVKPVTVSGQLRLYVTVASGTALSNATIRPMLVHGTTPQPYIPYGSLGLRVMGRNLLAYEASALSNGVMHVYDGTGACTIKGTATGASAISVANALAAGSVMLPAGTYTVSCWATPGYNTGSGGGVRADVCNASSSLVTNTERVGNTGAVQSASFTLSAATEVTIRANVGSNSVVDGTCHIQLESGSTAHEYTPYIDSTTPIALQSNVLASLPDGTHDELVVDELGGVKLVKRVGRVVYDGSESWEITTTSGVNLYRLSSQSSQTHWDTTTTGQLQRYCNLLGVVNSDSLLTSTPGTYRSMTHMNVNWDGTNNDLAGFKAALAATPLVLYYLTTQPTTIDLGTIDPPKLADGATIEALANLDTGISADWWAVGAGAVGDGLLALRDLLGAGE